MGFMDKAKKMAEQAQAKLDEAQKQFNAGQQQGQQSGPAVEYDTHGRPIAQATFEGAAPPHGDPLADQPPAAEAPPPIAQPGVPPTEAPPPIAQPGVPPTEAPPPIAQPGVPPTEAPPPIAQPGVPPTEAAAPPPPPSAAAPSAPPPAGAAPAPSAPPARPEADAADEDRNHPSYAPPKLSSGDPLAG
jgi:hypothetical protein